MLRCFVTPKPDAQEGAARTVQSLLQQLGDLSVRLSCDPRRFVVYGPEDAVDRLRRLFGDHMVIVPSSSF